VLSFYSLLFVDISVCFEGGGIETIRREGGEMAGTGRGIRHQTVQEDVEWPYLLENTRKQRI